VTSAGILALQWAALARAGMLTAASWTPSGGSATPADVMFDAPDALALDGVSANDWAMTYRAADWVGLRERMTVTVGGQAYTIRQQLAQSDGLLIRALLQRI
jgi:hypothetical protein